MRTYVLVLAAGAAPFLPGPPAPVALGLIGVLLAAGAFFSGSETAVVSASRARLQHLAEEGRRDARAALSLLEDTPRTIASTLVGTNLCNVGAASLATALAVGFSPDHGPALATAVLTPVVLFGAEILPKAFFRSHPTRLLRMCAGALRAFTVLFAPLLLVTSAATRGLLFLLRLPAAERRPVFRRQDLENLFLSGAVREESPEPRADRAAALRMAGKALDLRRKSVAEAMNPLAPEGTCPAGASVGQARDHFRACRRRILAALDDEGRVAGFVVAKQLLGEPADRSVARHIRPAYVLDPDDSLDDAIAGFRRHQQAIGLVRDRDGHTLGVVTAEDVLEEIVGDLPPGDAGRAPGSRRRASGNGRRGGPGRED